MKTVGPVQKEFSGESNILSGYTFLNTLDVSAMKLGLSRMVEVLETLGNPQDKIPTIHIAGTNGKGSTAAMLTAILKAAGYTVGTFTSPHLVEVRERICIHQQPLDETVFNDEIIALKDHLEALSLPQGDWPTYFEFLNMVAYQAFLREKVDIAVIEVGLGGRLDSTNIVRKPLVSVITSIGLDHLDRLGPTLTHIAQEKAGVIKPGVPVVVGPNLPEEAMAVIERKAQQEDAPLHVAHHDDLEGQGMTTEGHQGFYHPTSQQTLELSLLGPYQQDNLATVLLTLQQLEAQGWKIPQKALIKGLKTTQWPGRFQWIDSQQVLLDGSHNPDGFLSLQEGLSLYFAQRPKVWLVSLRTNRDPQTLIEVIRAFPETQAVGWTIGPKASLYHSPQVICEAFPEMGIAPLSTAEEGFEWIQQQLKPLPEGMGIVTGSLYTVGEVLKILNKAACTA